MPNIIDSQPGPEYLYGTADADVFRYLSLDDSRVGGSDGIIGFQSGTDKLDISAVDGGLVQILYQDPQAPGYGDSNTYTVVNFGRASNGGPADTVTLLGNVALSDLAISAGTGVYIDGGHLSRTLVGTDQDDVIQAGHSGSFRYSAGYTIIGGPGADVLVGSEYTSFVYRSLDDSRVGSEDHISGFAANPFFNGSNIDLTAVSSPQVLIDYRNESILYGPDEKGAFQDRIYVNALFKLSGLMLSPETSVIAIASDAGSYLQGTDGADSLIGGDGSDDLTGGAGADILTGGGGSDTFEFVAGDSPAGAGDFIRDFQTGIDHINVAAGPSNLVELYSAGNYSFLFYDSQSDGSFSQEIITHGVVARSDLGGLTFLTRGTDGPDTLIGGEGTNVLVGEGGADYLRSGVGSTAFIYTAASDSTPSAPDYIDGFRTGYDHISLSQAPGGAVILAYTSGGTYVGYAPDGSGAPQGVIGVGATVNPGDLLLSPDVHLIAILGSDATEALTGTIGVDYINGGGGDDFIFGGAGADGLIGGAGADTFVYAAVGDSTPAANDYIADLEHGVDKIDLRGVAGTELDIHHDEAGNSVLLYDFLGATPGGEIVVHGEVETSDVYVDSFTDIVISGAVAPPDPAELARERTLPHTAFAGGGHAVLA